MRQFLFRLARSRIAELFIGFAFAHLTPLMPLNAIHQSARLIVFPHPKPFWQTHFLIVPKTRIASISRLSNEDANHLLPEIIAIAKTIAAEQGMSDSNLLVNAGVYQDVPQLHFHLFSGQDANGSIWILNEEIDFEQADVAAKCDFAQAYLHPSPLRRHHFVLTGDEFADLLTLVQALVKQHQLSGYALLFSGNVSPTVHLISG